MLAVVLEVPLPFFAYLVESWDDSQQNQQGFELNA